MNLIITLFILTILYHIVDPITFSWILIIFSFFLLLRERIAKFFNDNKKIVHIITTPETNQYMSRQDKQAYMKSSKWKKLKLQRLSIANNKCEMCGYNKRLELHHITYENLGDELIDDVAIVCRKCHQKIHEKYGYSRKNFYPLKLKNKVFRNR